MAQNDWLALFMFNKGLEVDKLPNLGITASNTDLKPKDDYMNIPEVQERFKKKDGSFDQDAFDKYYDGALKTYNEFVSDEFDKELVDEYIYAPYDLSVLNPEDVKLPEVYVRKVANPTAKTYGMTMLGIEDPGRLSIREAAQNSKVWDYDAKEWLDFTPNDDDKRGLFDFWTMPSLVLAQWEEDGEHIQNGVLVRHQKGEYKYNEDGNPYYETLGNRDVAGKEMLRLTDTLTVDGTTANKWDPFDSDGIKKSPTKIAADLILNVVPYFIPYFGISKAYKLFQVLEGGAKMASVFGKAGLELSGQEESGIWNFLNNIDAKVTSISPTQSDHGASNMFSVEGIGAIIKDSASQLYSQRTIAQLPKLIGRNPLENKSIQKKLVDKFGKEYIEKFGKNLKDAMADGTVDEKFIQDLLTSDKGAKVIGKALDRYKNLSRSLGSLYMAGLQSAGVYETMKEHDWDPTSTALGLAGTFGGYYALMRYTSLGEVATRGLGLEGNKVIAKKWTKEEIDKISKAINQVDTTTKPGKLKAIKNVAKTVASFPTKVLGRETVTDMTREGLEEVSEEMLMDTVLGLISAGNYLMGSDSRYNPLQENMFERYMASMFGGALGGGVFRGLNKLETKIDDLRAQSHGKVVEKIPNDTFQDLVTTIRNGGAQSIKDVISSRMQKEKIASSKLSLEINKDTGDNSIFKVAKTKDESQNYQIGNYLINFIDALDTVINGTGYKTDDNNVVLSAVNKNLRLAALANSKVAQEILNDFNNSLSALVKAKMNTDQDNETVKETIKQNEEVLKNIIEGKNSQYYAGKMMFDMSPSINEGFYSSNLYLYANSKGLVLDNLSQQDKDNLQQEYEKIRKDNPGYKYKMYDAYLKFRKDLAPIISRMKQTGQIKNLRLANEAINKALQARVNALNEEESGKLIKLAKELFIRNNNGEENLYKELEKNGITKNPKYLKDGKFDLDKFVEENVKGTKEWEDALNQVLHHEIMDKIYTIDDAGRVGLDGQMILNLNQNTETTLANINGILDAMDQTIGSEYLDTMTASRLNNIANYLNNLNTYTIIDKATADTIMDANNNSIDLSSFTGSVTVDGTTAHDINPSIDTKLKRNEDKLYYLEGTIDLSGEIDDILQGQNGKGYITISGNNVKVNFTAIDPQSTIYKFKTDPLAETSDNIFTDLAKDEIKSKTVNSYTDLFGDGQPSILGNMVRQIVGNTIDSRLETINRIKKRTSLSKDSDLAKMVSYITTELMGQDALKIFENEQGEYATLNAPYDYAVSNDIAATQLHNIEKALDVLSSIMAGQTSDANEFLKFAQTLNADDQVELIDVDELNTLKKEIGRLEYNTDLVNQITERNRGNKVSEAKKTLNRLVALLPVRYSDAARNDAFNYGNGQNLFDGLLNRSVELDKLKDDDLLENLNYLRQINHTLYERFSKLEKTDKERIINSLAGLTEGDSSPIYKRDFENAAITSKSQKENISNDFMARYLYMHLVTDTEPFWDAVRDYIENTGKNMFAGQLLDLEMNWIYANQAYDEGVGVLDKFQELMKQYDTLDKHQTPPYVPNRNVIINPGLAGSGKTTFVAKPTFDLLRKSKQIRVWAVGPTEATATQLQSVLNREDGELVKDTYTREKLFKLLLKEAPNETDNIGINKYNNNRAEEIDKGQVDYAENDRKITKADINQDVDLPDYIFIDEITHFSKGDMAALNQIFNELGKNTIIFGFGDSSQEGIVDKDDDPIYATIGYVWTTPELGINVRSDNTSKQANMGKLSATAKKLREDNNKASRSGIKYDTRDAIDNLQNFKLVYHTENTPTGRDLHGEMVTKSLDFNLVDQLVKNLKDKEKIAYIGELNSDLAKKLEAKYGNKIAFHKPDNIQGAEYKYTIIDTNWGQKIAQGMSVGELRSAISKIYTLLSRSKVGTIILDDGSFSFQSTETPISRTVELDNKQMGEYHDFLLNGIKSNKVKATENSPSKKLNNSSSLEVSLDTLQDTEKAPSNNQQDQMIYTNIEARGRKDEDLNALVEGEPNEAQITSIRILRGLLVNSNSDIKSIIDIDRATNEELYNKVNRISEQLNLSRDDIRNGKYRIKVRAFDDLTDTDSSKIDTSKYKGGYLAKLVYSINKGGENIDITLGYIAKPNDKYPDLHPNIAEAEEYLKNPETKVQEVYLDLADGVNSVRRRRASFQTVDTNSMSKADRNKFVESHTVPEIQRQLPGYIYTKPLIAHKNLAKPELTTRIVNQAKEDNKKGIEATWVPKGKTFMLTSRDLTTTPEDIINRYALFMAGQIGPEQVADLSVFLLNTRGVTPAKYFQLWDQVIKGTSPNIGKGHLKHSLNGAYFGSKLLKLFYDVLKGNGKDKQQLFEQFKELVTTGDSRLYNKAEFDQNIADFAKELEKLQGNSLILDDENKISQIDWSTLDHSKLLEQLDTKSQAVLTKINERAKNEQDLDFTKYVNIVNEEVNGDNLDENNKLVKFKESLNELNKGELGKLLHETSLGLNVLFENDVLVQFINGTNITNRFASMYKNNPFIKLFMDTIISNSQEFKDGMIINPMASNTLKNSVGDLTFGEAALEPEYYWIRAEIGTPHIYLDDNQILPLDTSIKTEKPVQNTEQEATVQEEPVVEPAQDFSWRDTAKSGLGDAIENNDTMHNVDSDYDQVIVKFKEDLKTRINIAIDNNTSPIEFVQNVNSMFKNLAGGAVFNNDGIIVGTYPMINLDYNEGTGKFNININSITSSANFTNNYDFSEVINDNDLIEDSSMFSEVENIYEHIKFIGPRKAIMYTGMITGTDSLYEIDFNNDGSIIINQFEGDESLYSDFKNEENLINQC